MSDETVLFEAETARAAALSGVLAGALRPPETPSDLRAGVLAAIARESPVDWQACRRQLQQEHRAAVGELRQRYLRRCRDAVLIGAGLLAVLGFSIEPLSVGLAPYFANAAPMVAGFIALSVGVLCGAAFLQDLFKGANSEGVFMAKKS